MFSRTRRVVNLFRLRRSFATQSDLQKLVSERDFKSVISTCDKLLIAEPNNPDVLLYKAIALQNQSLKTIPDAIDVYQHIINITPENYEAKKNLSKLLIDAYNRYEDMLPHLEDLFLEAKDNTEKAELLRYKARCLWRLKKKNSALQVIQESILHNQHDTESLLMLAKMHIINDDYAQAIDVLDIVLANTPMEAEALYLLAIAQRDMRQLEKSADTCDRGMRADPDDVRFMITKATVLLYPTRKVDYEEVSRLFSTVGLQYAANPFSIPPYLRSLGSALLGFFAPDIRLWNRVRRIHNMVAAIFDKFVSAPTIV
jgi:tetratricopeptide (TPR) repeat protein